jgi:hypothetical protein
MLRDPQDRAVSGLEPWLGALAHLVLIHQDAATFVHSHPSEGLPTSNESSAFAGIIMFSTHFPKPGLYKAWLQVQYVGKVLTFPFVIQVHESPFGTTSRE